LFYNVFAAIFESEAKVILEGGLFLSCKWEGGGETRMMRFFRRNRKAVSPVIATIIIVGIAIVMSIAVAYWLMGLVSPGKETLQFVSGYATADASNFYMNITLKNIGSKDATIDLVFLNAKPYSSYGNVQIQWNGTVAAQYPVKIGDVASGYITLAKTPSSVGNWTSGISVDVNVHSVAGYEYPKSIVLP
jgi:hypothetical protein